MLHLDRIQDNENGVTSPVTRAHHQNSLALGLAIQPYQEKNDIKYIK